MVQPCVAASIQDVSYFWKLIDEEHGEIELARMLDLFPELIDLKDEDDRSPLHRAVSSGNLEIVELFLKKGSFCLVFDQASWSPLHIAASKKRVDIVNSLVKNISKQENVAMVDFLDGKTESGNTALHYACAKGSLEVVEYLLSSGASATIRDRSGQLAFHRAASIGSIPIVERLLSVSSNFVNSKDTENNTPLHLAVENGELEMAKFLLSKGADPNVENKEKVTPDQMAKLYGYL